MEEALILFTTPLYTAVILLEIALSHFRHWKAYTFKDTVANMYLMLANAGVDLLFRSVYVVFLNWVFQFRFFEIASPFWYWAALLIAEDFVFYWLHRFDHHSRFFWAVHVTHHSSEKYNLTVGFRSSVFQPLYRFVYFIPLALMGFKPIDMIFIFAVTQIWGILVHTEHVGKLGWLEYLLVTPSHHRVHHASNALYLDKNLGMFLIIWDKLFGTFQAELPAEKYEALRYGLTSKADNNNPFTLIFHEWIQIAKDIGRSGKWRDKLYYIFGPPGWSHDGSRKTSEELRKYDPKVQQIIQEQES
jgi:sterol desaturase/sphingolipid hydroxylase (fatty acid hydroxylase superfamily)